MPKKSQKKGKSNFKFKTSKGIQYEVVFRKPDKRHKAVGLCSSPKDDSPRVQISPHLSKQVELNTSIHEFAHAFFWDKSETDIAKFANALSRFLYTRCGWRKVEK